MKRTGLAFRSGRAAADAAMLAGSLLAGGCDFSAAPDDKPTEAVIRIEGLTPNPLKLITSTDFTEQYNTVSMEYRAVLFKSDTLEIAPPYNATVDLGALGSVYVELRQPDKGTASVRMRVELDNGEGYDQSATLTDNSALIYWFLFTDYVLR